MLVGNSIIKEQVDIFCNRGRKICNRLCIPGGNIQNISDVVSKLGNSRGHVNWIFHCVFSYFGISIHYCVQLI